MLSPKIKTMIASLVPTILVAILLVFVGNYYEIAVYKLGFIYTGLMLTLGFISRMIGCNFGITIPNSNYPIK